MGLYKKIAAIESDEDREDVLDEMIDRYGEAPKEALNLLDVALVRAAARACGVTSIIEDTSMVKIRQNELDFMIWHQLSNEFRGRLRLGGGDTPSVNFRKQSGENVLDVLLKLFIRYAEIVKEEENLKEG